MHSVRGIALIGSVLVLSLAGCAPVVEAEATDADPEMTAILVTSAEADELGGWVVTPDQGSVDGDTADCTGAPYDWPDLTTLGHASQFLDRDDESLALAVKRLDGKAAAQIEAVRGALAPCTPASGEILHGAMIEPLGDDSFAYQTNGSDERGDFTFSNMLVACGDVILEVLSQSYSGTFLQAQLEDVVRPAVDRVLVAGGC